MMGTKKRWAIGAVAALLAIGFGAALLWRAAQSADQVSTQATLQTISARVRNELPDLPSQERLEAVVADTHGGVDGWGHPILVVICDEPSGYLVLSKGSDNLLDVDFASDYCELDEQTSVLGEHSRDIVFRNGKALQAAGK